MKILCFSNTVGVNRAAGEFSDSLAGRIKQNERIQEETVSNKFTATHKDPLYRKATRQAAC